MNPEVRQTTQSLAFRSSYALLLLVLLAGSNFWIIQSQVRESKSMANRVGRYTRQLELVYRASSIATAMRDEGLDPRGRSEARESLLVIASILERNHRILIHGDTEAGIPPTTSPHIRSIYFDPPSRLDRRMRDYLTALQGVGQNGMAPFTLTDEAYARRLEQVMSIGNLQDSLTSVLNYYRNEGSAKTFLVEQLNLWHFCSTMAVLAFVALLVFFPMIRRIQQVMTNLAGLNATLEQRVSDRTSALIARARELEASNDVLRELRAAMENAVEGIARVGADGVLASANAAFATVFNKVGARTEGNQWQEWIEPGDQPHLRQALEKAREQGSAELEVQLAETPAPSYLQLTIVKAQDRHGDFDGYHFFAKDITPRKSMEEALRESEVRFRQLTDNLQQVLWLSDAGQQRVVYVSPAFETIFGQPRESLYGAMSVWYDAIHPDDRERVITAREHQLLSDGYDEEYRIVKPDGNCRWIRDRAFPIRVEGQDVRRIAGIAEDITQARHMQHQLLLSQRSFENLIMNCDVAMIVTDSDGRAQFVNPAAQTLLRKKSEEILGSVFSLAVMEAERNEIPLMEGGAMVGIAEINLIRTEWDGEVAHLLILHDITDRKRAEEELHAYANELQRSNKELEDFAFVASHDLQEPLRKIKAFGDRLTKKYGEALGKEGQMYLDRMQNASQRMDRLIRDLLTYSRVTTKAQPFDTVDLNDVVSEVLSDLEVRVEQSGGSVEVDPMPTIEADPMQMRQLFQNLIGNALKFRRAGVAPLVRVSCEPVWDRPALLHETPAQAVQMCRIMVSDNGIGFDEKYLDRIFEVFQRLHGRDAYEGTGTGLAVCRKIANRHNGTITARSKPDEGATFLVTLPIQQKTADEHRN